MKKKFLLPLYLIFVATLTTGCLYRMPEEDEFSLIPNTNHPDVTREQSSDWMPSVGM